jgi:hypothetical protein
MEERFFIYQNRNLLSQIGSKALMTEFYRIESPRRFSDQIFILTNFSGISKEFEVAQISGESTDEKR